MSTVISKMAFSHLAKHWFIIHNTTMVHYLYAFKAHSTLTTTWQYVAFKWAKALQYAMYLIVLLRTIYLSTLAGNDNALMKHLPYNPLLTSIVLRFHILSGDTLKALSLLGFFALHIDYLVSFNLDHFLLTILHQLMIDNGRQLFQLNERTLAKPRQAKFYQSRKMLREYVHLSQILWRSTSLRFKHKHLQVFPHISKHLRAKLVLISAISDWIISRLLIVIALILALFVIGFFTLVYSELPLWLLAFSAFDIVFIAYASWNTVRMGLFLIHDGIVLSFTSNAHINELIETRLRPIVHGHSKLFKYKDLQLFYSEYHRLKYLAIYDNGRIISPLLAVLFLTNIAVNIVMLSHLIFSQLYASEKAAIALFCFGQTFLSFCGCATLITWAKSLYRPERILFQVQHRLVSRLNDPLHKRALLTLVKVKLMTFYEFVCSRKSFRFTIGFLGSISTRSLYEFLFAYSGMVMYVSKIVRQHTSSN